MMTLGKGRAETAGSSGSKECESPVVSDDEDDANPEDRRVTLGSQTISKCLKMFGKNESFRLITGEIRDKIIVSSSN